MSDVDTQRLTDIRLRDDESPARMGPQDREFWGDLDRRYLLDALDRLARTVQTLRAELAASERNYRLAEHALTKVEHQLWAREDSESLLAEVVAKSIRDNA